MTSPDGLTGTDCATCEHREHDYCVEGDHPWAKDLGMWLHFRALAPAAMRPRAPMWCPLHQHETLPLWRRAREERTET